MSNNIKAEIVAHSLSPQGEELMSVLATFPRIILAEVNTHRMLSKNTSSSRAIPFKKMMEAVQNNPFIPIAWQKEHSGMQGSEYITDSHNLSITLEDWLAARDNAVKYAERLSLGFEDELSENEQRVDKVTKQLCNRLLEPFMWTTMLITGSKEGWDNFFRLRCPSYESHKGVQYKSWKDYIFDSSLFVAADLSIYTQLEKLQCNKGQAEIHIMDLAEKIWDARNESTPKQLNPGEWHIPFGDKINVTLFDLEKSFIYPNPNNKLVINQELAKYSVKVSTAMAARTSYTVVGDEKAINYENMIALHDRLLNQEPPHSSPFEHTARAMDDEEYTSFIKGNIHDFANRDLQKDVKAMTGKTFIVGEAISSKLGWCYNLKGFIPYRYLVDNKLEL